MQTNCHLSSKNKPVMTLLLRVIRVMIYSYIYIYSVRLFRSMVCAHPRCLAVRSGVIHSLTQTLASLPSLLSRCLVVGNAGRHTNDQQFNSTFKIRGRINHKMGCQTQTNHINSYKSTLWPVC